MGWARWHLTGELGWIERERCQDTLLSGGTCYKLLYTINRCNVTLLMGIPHSCSIFKVGMNIIMLSRAEEVLNYLHDNRTLYRDSLIAALLFTDVCDLTGPTERRGKPHTKISVWVYSLQTVVFYHNRWHRQSRLSLPGDDHVFSIEHLEVVISPGTQIVNTYL